MASYDVARNMEKSARPVARDGIDTQFESFGLCFLSFITSYDAKYSSNIRQDLELLCLSPLK